MQESQCLVRVYVLEGFQFASRDIGSHSDPYIKIQCGKKTVSDRDNYQLNEANPKIFRHFDLNVTFPGAAPLYIYAYDFDDLFGDDLIGVTKVDLDDRWFSAEW